MTLINDLDAKVDQFASDFTDFVATVDAFITSDAANFAALQAALAANDTAGVAAIIAKIDAARATLATEKDKVSAADAADNLPA